MSIIGQNMDIIDVSTRVAEKSRREDWKVTLV